MREARGLTGLVRDHDGGVHRRIVGLVEASQVGVPGRQGRAVRGKRRRSGERWISIDIGSAATATGARDISSAL